MLEVRDLSLGYGETTVLSGIDFALEENAIGCLLGPSGSGKTSLLRAIAGFVGLSNGEINIDHKCVVDKTLSMPPEQRNVGFVFQDYALFPHLTVAENVAFGLQKWSKPQIIDRVQTCLQLVGLSAMQSRYPHELSGGQRQRVALVRALAPRPQLLLLDEPFSSLDVALRDALAAEMRAIIKAEDMTALIVTHDQHEAFSVADEIGVFAEGKLQQWGDASALYHQPKTQFVANFIGDGALIDLDQDRKTVLIRPEHVEIAESGRFVGQVMLRHFRGDHFMYEISLQPQQGFALMSSTISCKGSISQPLGVNTEVKLNINFAQAASI